MSLEVLALGRVSVDLYPEQVGVRLADVRTVRKMLGGSPTNVAVAAARLGRRSAVVTKVGADGFGEYVRSALVELERTIRFANAAGALVASRLGCADDMPTADEVEALQCAA